VSGTTEPGVTLEVNGVLVAVDGNGGFSVELALLEGENEIMAVATDPAGNSATDSASVTFDDPQEDLIEDIQDELDVLQEELDQLYDVLDVVNDRLNDTWIDLTAAVGELEEVSSELNDTEDSLIDSQGELDDANGRIDSLTSLVTMLAAVTILLAALVVVMMLMHLRSRKGPGTPSVEERELPPPE
jgi:methyl-accepting chemotaxis protein